MSKREEKEHYWKSILSEYSNRSCGREEFCRERNIKPATLQYHQARLKAEESKSFLPVSVSPPEPERESVLLEFSSGLRLTIRA